MKILMLCDVNLDGKDAQPVHVIEIAKNLKKEKHDVILLAPALGRYIQNISEIKYILILNVLVLRSVTYNFFLIFYLIFYFLKFKMNVIYIRFGMLPISVVMSKILRIKCIVEINGLIPEEINMLKMQNNTYLLNTLYSSIIQLNLWLSCKFSDKIVAVAEGIKKELCEKYKLHSDKIVVISNGANTDLFKPMDKEKVKEELNLDKNTYYVCWVGNLAPWQGVEYLIKAGPLILQEIPNTKFLIVGDGVMKKELVKTVKELNLENSFIFTGPVDYELVPKYINASDICVAPFIKKRNEKASPLKIYEYASCGKPIVASRMSNLEFIEEQNAGILVEPENLEELSKSIIKLIKNEKLREKMGRNGREYVVKYHSWRDVAKRVAEVCALVMLRQTSQKLKPLCEIAPK